MGELNHRYFLFFLLANTVFFYYGSYLLFLVLASDVYRLNLFQSVFVDPATDQQYRATWLMVLNYIAYRNLELVSLFFFALIMGIAVTLFLAYHLYLLACGATTNETYKLDTFRSIHQDMVKAHERYTEDESKRGATGEIGNSSESAAADDGREDKADDDDGREVDTATIVDPLIEASPSFDPQLSSSGAVDDVSVECPTLTPTSSSSVPPPPNCPIPVHPSSKPRTVEMHPIRAFCEEYDRMPDQLPTHPGPFPRNIYCIGFWASLR